MTEQETLVLIPARMAASRLPGKPLLDIAGLPMIAHVLRRAEAARLGRVAVATDSAEIAAAVTAQGGEAVMTRAVLQPFSEPTVDIATLAAEIRVEGEHDNPNVVKVVGSPLSEDTLRALYFTRSTAPYGEGPRYHHIGLYAYRRAALARFVALPPSPLERREKLEQLRALEAGMRIDVRIVDSVPLGVDTAHDLEAARRTLATQAS
jgi:3-deoxy-manno-octulosonate cytidylyltransferase (CMP-KDO synthetase)